MVMIGMPAYKFQLYLERQMPCWQEVGADPECKDDDDRDVDEWTSQKVTAPVVRVS